MSFFIIPLGSISRLFRKGAAKILGKDELEDLRSDLIVPVTEFVDEVYNDTVGEVLRQREGNNNGHTG